MPYKALMATAVVVASVSGTAWLLSADNDGKFSWLPFGSHQDHQEANAMARDRTPQANEANEANASNAPAPSDNALGFMLASVADDYQRSARYPDYSVPLNTAQAEAYQGNRYHPVELPLEDDGSFIVTLDKFRFTQGEPILVVASLSGRQVFGDTLSATLSRRHSNRPPKGTRPTQQPCLPRKTAATTREPSAPIMSRANTG